MRFHPLRGEWKIYAEHHLIRTFKPSAADDPLAPTVPGGPPTKIPFADLELAVFENRFSAFHPDAPLHAAPHGSAATYHFTAQFYPLLRGPGRVKYLASVEQHTEMFTVDIIPETAAAALRLAGE